jgi:RecA/RadA recombinase
MGRKRKEEQPDRAEILAAPRPEMFPEYKRAEMLSTGCTLLNVHLSTFPEGAIAPGMFVYYVGESGSDKTWLALSVLAEAARHPRYAPYRFVYDNAENGALMDLTRYFGPAMTARLHPPTKTAIGSSTVQEFYYNVELAVRAGPCIYILDSLDALQDQSELDNFEAQVKYYDTGTGKSDIKGEMGTGKAKANSRNLGRVVNQTLSEDRENKSILIIISQTRQKLGAQYPTRTRSGGDALRFYAHLELWTRVTDSIKVTYRGKDREIGKEIEVKVAKNRLRGRVGPVGPIIHLIDHGIDDTGTSVDYLLSENRWKTEGSGDKRRTIHVPEFEDFSGSREELIRHIETNSLQSRLGEIVAATWEEIRTAVTPERKTRYSS